MATPITSSHFIIDADFPFDIRFGGNSSRNKLVSLDWIFRWHKLPNTNRLTNTNTNTPTPANTNKATKSTKPTLSTGFSPASVKRLSRTIGAHHEFSKSNKVLRPSYPCLQNSFRHSFHDSIIDSEVLSKVLLFFSLFSNLFSTISV